MNNRTTPTTYRRFFMINYNFYEDFPKNETIKKNSTKHHFHYSILHESDNDIILFNDVLDESSEICGYALKRVDHFSKLKWHKTSKEYVQSYKNFNNCTLSVGAKDIVQKFSKIDVRRINFNVAEIFTRKFNITFKYEEEGDDLNEIISTLITLHTWNNRNDSLREDLQSYQQSIILYDSITFQVTKGANYTEFEKIILPFDCPAWYMITATFAIGYSVIFITYRFPRLNQNSVFGTFIRNPSLNLTMIFFGIGLVQTPGRNFARFLFMLFTIYSLIIRTAYQSKMFEFMTSDVYHPTATTVDELFEMKIPIICYSELACETINM